MPIMDALHRQAMLLATVCRFFFVSTTHTSFDIKKSKKKIKIAITFWGRGFDPFDPRLLSIKLDVVLSLNGGSCGVGSDVRVPQTMTVAGTRTYKEESTLGPRPKNLESSCAFCEEI
ncbi:hypothetical protein SFRURICE_010828 [Spodoptera frugiperda]|nr:hypothetical protein SFRURICE_010828 [Spodoptera frugiperda]